MTRFRKVVIVAVVAVAGAIIGVDCHRSTGHGLQTIGFILLHHGTPSWHCSALVCGVENPLSASTRANCRPITLA